MNLIILSVIKIIIHLTTICNLALIVCVCRVSMFLTSLNRNNWIGFRELYTDVPCTNFFEYLCFQEMQELKNALYPNLMCSAAKTGNIISLEKLRKTVSVLGAEIQFYAKKVSLCKILWNMQPKTYTKSSHDIWNILNIYMEYPWEQEIQACSNAVSLINDKPAERYSPVGAPLLFICSLLEHCIQILFNIYIIYVLCICNKRIINKS